MVSRRNGKLHRSILTVLAAAAAALVPAIALAAPGDEASAAPDSEEAAPKAASDKAEKVEKVEKVEKTDKPATKHAAKKARHAKASPPKAQHAKSTASSSSPKAKKAKKSASRTPSKKKASEKKAPDTKAPPANAAVGSRSRAPRSSSDDRQWACYGVPVRIDRVGSEGETLPLLDCGGRPVDRTREKLSVLARPWGMAPPDGTSKAPARVTFLLDPGLSVRLEAIARRFPGKTISIVSGFRPKSGGSLHQHARALDVRMVGVANEELVAFCKTMSDTGCGYYPNSSFVHVDVREPGTGSVTWIDASGPGEQPRYVTQWPEPPGMNSAPPRPTPAEPHGDATSDGVYD